MVHSFVSQEFALARSSVGKGHGRGKGGRPKVSPFSPKCQVAMPTHSISTAAMSAEEVIEHGVKDYCFIILSLVILICSGSCQSDTWRHMQTLCRVLFVHFRWLSLWYSLIVSHIPRETTPGSGVLQFVCCCSRSRIGRQEGQTLKEIDLFTVSFDILCVVESVWVLS